MISFLISLIFPIILFFVSIFFSYKTYKTYKVAGDKSSKFNFIGAIVSLIFTIYFGISIKPPAPIILPLDNETHIYSDNVKITIDSDGFDVYYTLDGSDPKNGIKYNQPIIITNSTTVSVRSKFLWKWGELTQSAYKFESIPITVNNSTNPYIDDKFISLNEIGDLLKIIGGIIIVIYLLKIAIKDGLINLFRY